MAWSAVALVVCEPLEDVQDCVGLQDGESVALFAVDGGDLEVDLKAALVGHMPNIATRPSLAPSLVGVASAGALASRHRARWMTSCLPGPPCPSTSKQLYV